MPSVTKQNAKPQLPTSTGVLSRIVKVSAADTDGIKLTLYGRGKTGKTRLACTFPKPLLLIGTEKGTRSVSTVQGVDFVRLSRSAEIEELAAMLKGGKYKSAALDTAGGLQDLIVKEVLGLDEVPVQRSWGMAQQRDWGVIGAQTKERLRQLLDLSEQVGLNVVIVAHERSFGDSEASDLVIPSVGAALTPTAAAWLNGACDYVCQTFIREKAVYKESKVGGSTVKIKQPTGEHEYCLRVGPHSVFMTGFRLPEGIVLPDSIVNPSYEKIDRLIRGKPV